VLGEVWRMVHAKESDMDIGSAEPAFGWNFYILTLDKEVARWLAQLPESSIFRVKGDLLEQKFVNWLKQQVKANNFKDKIHFNLLLDLKSSQYGLF
jgi:hypothetical protein